MSTNSDDQESIPAWARVAIYLFGGIAGAAALTAAGCNVAAARDTRGVVGLLPAGLTDIVAVVIAVAIAGAGALAVHGALSVGARPRRAPAAPMHTAGPPPPAVEVREVVRTVRVTEPMRPAAEETDVYRLYDVADALLYVGIGSKARARWLVHARKQPWWPSVARHQTLRYPFRGQALAVEQSAIEHEQPRHNRNGGGLTDAGWPHGWRQPQPVTGPLPPADQDEEAP